MADRVAVFDLDGTLADTAPDLVGGLNAVLRAEGLPEAPMETARRTAGLGGRALLRQGFELAGRTLSDDEIESRLPAFLAAYEARIDQKSRFFAGAEAALDTLSGSGWTVAICTNKPERLALILLEKLGQLDRFAAVLGADTLPVRKPDARHVIETIARSGGQLERAVMIGDTETDSKAAQNAGVPVVLVRFGYSLKPLDELGPDAQIDAFDELPAVLDRLRPA